MEPKQTLGARGLCHLGPTPSSACLPSVWKGCMPFWLLIRWCVPGCWPSTWICSSNIAFWTPCHFKNILGLTNVTLSKLTCRSQCVSSLWLGQTFSTKSDQQGVLPSTLQNIQTLRHCRYMFVSCHLLLISKDVFLNVSYSFCCENIGGRSTFLSIYVQNFLSLSASVIVP